MIAPSIAANLPPLILNLRLDASRRRRCVPILVYHQVRDVVPTYPLRHSVVSPAQFEQQMALLSGEGYRSISLDEFIAMRQQGSIPAGRYFVLTFDDGYRDNYLRAFPILREFGFKATIFLISDWLLHGNDGREMPVPILRLEDIVEMSRCGIAFGAHTRSHRSLTTLSLEEAKLEIQGSKEALESYLNQPIRFFSYPYGHSDAVIRSIVKTHGFKAAFATDNGSDDLFNLRRVGIMADDSLLDFRLKIRGWKGRPLRALKWLERKPNLQEVCP